MKLMLCRLFPVAHFKMDDFTPDSLFAFSGVDGNIFSAEQERVSAGHPPAQPVG